MTAPLDLDALKPTAFAWWKDMPWSAACVSVKDAVPMMGLPTATYAALVSELRAAREALAFYADPDTFDVDEDGGKRARAAISRAATGGKS